MFVQLFGIVFGKIENINNIGTMKRDFRKYTHSHKNCRFHVYKIGKVRSFLVRYGYKTNTNRNCGTLGWLACALVHQSLCNRAVMARNGRIKAITVRQCNHCNPNSQTLWSNSGNPSRFPHHFSIDSLFVTSLAFKSARKYPTKRII